jgi:hypothetical protein|tara:strand:- start:3321 stop:3590 length:270 start_codon:yes stop_codon:yes gene_type:complete
MSSEYRKNYDGIKWTRGKSRKSAEKAFTRAAHGIMRDIEPFISPVDGSYVTSRSQLREHEKRHNVRQIGNDWAGSERPSNWDTIRNVNN